MFTRVELIVVGELGKGDVQLIAAAEPDLTPEEWIALGQQICKTFAEGRVQQTSLTVNDEGNMEAAIIKGRLHKGPKTEH